MKRDNITGRIVPQPNDTPAVKDLRISEATKEYRLAKDINRDTIKRVATEFSITTFGELDSPKWNVDLTIEMDKELVKEPEESEVYLGITFTKLTRRDLINLRNEINTLIPE